MVPKLETAKIVTRLFQETELPKNAGCQYKGGQIVYARSEIMWLAKAGFHWKSAALSEISAPQQSLLSVQSSFANVNLMNAIFGFAWAVEVVMGR